MHVAVKLYLREGQIKCVQDRGEHVDLRIERQKIMKVVA
jgi:hypothetical protein